MNDATYDALCEALRMSKDRRNPESAPPTLREALHFVAGQLARTNPPTADVLRDLMEATRERPR